LSDFKRWHKAGYTSELLPIGPPGAPLSPASKIKPEMVGKIPMVRGANGLWCGYGGWTRKSSTVEKLKTWSLDGAGVGFKTERYPALDIDCDDSALSDSIEAKAREILGPAPVRFRARSARRLMLYRLAEAEEPFRKRRRDWTDAAGALHAVELLGAGQQFVAEGPHPKGGRYEWREWHPCDAVRGSPCRCRREKTALAPQRPAGRLRPSSWHGAAKGELIEHEAASTEIEPTDNQPRELEQATIPQEDGEW
jgi:hypothetical protein